MNASARWQLIYRVRNWCAAWLAAVCAVSGAGLALITIAVGLFDALSLTKVIILSLASGAITITGLVNYLISDSRTARRRGFQLGFRVGVATQPDGSRSDDSALSTRPSQLSLHNAPPTARHGSRD
jgi:hypothetical protein